MRFAAANKVNSGSWVEAGKNAADQAAGLFQTTTAYSNDYGGMANAWLNAQSKEQQVAMKAQADVASKAISVDGQVKKAKYERESQKVKRDLDRKQKFAGKLSAFAGGLAESWAKKKEPPAPPAQVDTDAVRELEREIYGNKPDTQKPETPPAQEQPAPATAQTPPADTTLPPSSGTPGNLSAPASKEQLRTWARNAGFPESELDTVVAVALAESRGIPNNHNGKGDDNSFGIMQINMLDRPGYMMGEERRTRWGLNSNEDLFDPQTNFNAAYDVWKQQGWKGWGAYTNQSYLDFL